MICSLSIDEAKEIIAEHLKNLGYDLQPSEDDDGECIFFPEDEYGQPEFWFSLGPWDKIFISPNK